MVGVGVAVRIPVSKSGVSMSYVLTSIGISALTFIGFLALEEFGNITISTLGTVGRNALVVFLVHYVLVRAGHRLVSSSSSFFMVMCGASGIYLLCYGVAVWLQAKQMYLKV